MEKRQLLKLFARMLFENPVEVMLSIRARYLRSCKSFRIMKNHHKLCKHRTWNNILKWTPPHYTQENMKKHTLQSSLQIPGWELFWTCSWRSNSPNAWPRHPSQRNMFVNGMHSSLSNDNAWCKTMWDLFYQVCPTSRKCSLRCKFKGDFLVLYISDEYGRQIWKDNSFTWI